MNNLSKNGNLWNLHGCSALFTSGNSTDQGEFQLAVNIDNARTETAGVRLKAVSNMKAREDIIGNLSGEIDAKRSCTPIHTNMALTACAAQKLQVFRKCAVAFDPELQNNVLFVSEKNYRVHSPRRERK